MTDLPAVIITRNGPSVLDCLEAAMRADPSLTIEEAIRMVPIGVETAEGDGA
jgi:hypothetical protein